MTSNNQVREFPDQNHRIEFSLHSSMFNPDGVRPFADLYLDLDSVLRKDMLCHYSGAISASYWIGLCRDKRYDHCKLVDLIDRNFPLILRNLHTQRPESTSLSLVSLGPGNGEIDVRILKHLGEEFDLRCYYCVDFSFELLRYAVSRISTAGILKNNFRIKAILGNFAEADTHLNGEDSVRLFALTGFTLGNYNEMDLLGKISRLMTERDFLFLDAHLHNHNDWNGQESVSEEKILPLLNNYCQEKTNRFVFGPVETATTASAGDVTFGHRFNRDTTSVPNAINITIFCRNLRTTMRFTGERVERNELDLATTTFYEYKRLKHWFPLAGFDCVWDRQEDNIGIFLLKRSTDALE